MKGKKYLVSITMSIFFLCVIGYGVIIEPNMLEVSHLQVDNINLGEGLKGRTAIHISDLHIEKIGKIEKKILEIIKDEDPDFIFLTGDYVEWQGDYEPALNFLSMLNAKVGVWAVMGDYDYSSSRKSCLFCHEKGTGKPTKRHNVRFLRNSAERLELSKRSVVICGIDYNGSEEFEHNTPAIVLSHSPLSFDDFDSKEEILMLSGDTHGGQVVMPSWFFRLLGYEKNAKYNHGFFQDGNKTMYVSRGIGTSHVPIRFLRRPEIVVIHF